MISQWWLTGAYFSIALLSAISGRVKNTTYTISVGFAGSWIFLCGGFYNAIYVDNLWIRLMGLIVYGCGGYLFFVYSEWLKEEREFRLEMNEIQSALEEINGRLRRRAELYCWRHRN